MKKELHILFVEDVPADVGIVQHALRHGGLMVRTRRVDTKAAFVNELETHPPDVILSDHGLPSFDGFAALAIAREKCPEIPFIFVTTAMGEETAIETFENGATDYVLKDNLSKLGPAIEKALREAEERTLLKSHERELRDTQERYRALVDAIADHAVISLDRGGVISGWSRCAQRIYGYSSSEVEGLHFAMLFSRQATEANPLHSAAAEGRIEEEGVGLRKNGQTFPAQTTLTALRDERGGLRGYAQVTRDLSAEKHWVESQRQSDQRYLDLAELCPEALLVVRDDGIVFVNRAAAALLGAQRPEQLVSKPIKDLVHADSWELFQARWQPPRGKGAKPGLAGERRKAEAAAKPGVRPHAVEVRFVRLDGSVLSCEVTGTSRMYQGRPAAQLLARPKVATSATTGGSSEDQIRLATVLESAFDAILYINAEGLVGEWNPAAERLFRYSREQALGRPVDELIISNSLREAYQGGLANYLLTGVASLLNRAVEMTLRRADGTEFQAEVAVTRSRPEGLVGCVAVIRDITERKQAEAALRKREQQYRLLIESLRDYAIYLLDPDGRVSSWNAGAERLEGYRTDEIIGQHFSIFFTAEERERGEPEAALQKALLRGETRNEGWRVRKDGSRFWTHGIITALYDENGKHYGFAKVAHDVTERKRADDTISRLNAELEARVVDRTRKLEAALQELESFSYSVSHDLRAPLRHILSYIEILESDVGPNLPAEAHQHVNIISQSARQMGYLIEALLGFARYGRVELHRQPVNLSAIAADAQDALSEELKGREVTWRIAKLPQVHGDPMLLRQVLINLFSNAVKYTRGRTPAVIELGVEDQPDETVFFVRDNGVGFDMAYVDKLFGVFQRLHSSTEFEGVGIGLANVRRVIHRHGGRIWAESAPGKGATFYFSLPKSPRATE